MYERADIVRIYTDGTLEQMFRACGVPPEDWADLKQEVAVVLLTRQAAIRHLEDYAFRLSKHLYFGSGNRREKEWRARRVGLSYPRGEVPEEGGDGDI